MSRKLTEKELYDEAEKMLNGSSDESVCSFDNESVHFSSSENEMAENKSADSDDEVHEVPIKQRRISAKQNTDMFNWSRTRNFIPKNFDFDIGNSGVTASFALDANAQEMDYFTLFFDEHLLDLIVKETNRYAQQNSNKVKYNDCWVVTDTAEMYKFFGVNILMGIIEKPALRDYWSKRKSIQTPYFNKVFKRDRFLCLLYNLHFINNEDENLNQSDVLKKLRPVFQNLQNKFTEGFYPFQDICIDESLVLWKGRLSFKQYIPSKRNRFGIKLYESVDCDSGYILGLIIYVGSKTELDEDDKGLGTSGTIVKTLLKKYLQKNHVLYVDNWYSSPTLFQYLFEESTGACGTVKPNRKGMPEFVQKLDKGECETASTENMIAMKWVDKRPVHMLSTTCTAHMTGTGKIDRNTNTEMLKPDCVIKYNDKMGGVDKADMQVSFVECARKTLKWYKKLFFHLMDISLYNAFVLYQVRTGKKPHFSEFRLNVAEQIIEKFNVFAPRTNVATVDNPLRLTERHFPVAIPQTAAGGSRTQRRCRVCSQTKLQRKRRQSTRFMCSECDVALCVTPCFKIYHTYKVY